MQDLIGYNKIVNNAMREVVHQVLKKITEHGLQSDHHFVIRFFTKSAGLSQGLLGKFPERMTIIVQHQFRSLKVEKDKFSIVLSFSGNLEKLVIPYNSIISLQCNIFSRSWKSISRRNCCCTGHHFKSFKRLYKSKI